MSKKPQFLAATTKRGTNYRKVLDELEKTPFISVAAEKAGLSGRLVYERLEKDAAYLKQVYEAILTGERRISDLAEMNVLKAIEKGDVTHSKFWLGTRSSRYKKSNQNVYGTDELERFRAKSDIQTQKQLRTLEKEPYLSPEEFEEKVKRAQRMLNMFVDEKTRSDKK